jgi:hypothetical protein
MVLMRMYIMEIYSEYFLVISNKMWDGFNISMSSAVKPTSWEFMEIDSHSMAAIAWLWLGILVPFPKNMEILIVR